MSNRQRIKPQRIGKPRSAIAAYVRRRCSDCGSPGITWMTVGQAAEHGLDVAKYEQFLAEVGGVSDVWVCRTCGESGAFGRDE